MQLVVGLAGFEPTTFTRKQRLSVPTGFSKTAPELRHPLRSANLFCLPSGARRHARLDYDPTLDTRHKVNVINKNICVIIATQTRRLNPAGDVEVTIKEWVTKAKG